MCACTSAYKNVTYAKLYFDLLKQYGIFYSNMQKFKTYYGLITLLQLVNIKFGLDIRYLLIELLYILSTAIRETVNLH